MDDHESLRKLLHALREALGALAIDLALFADQRLSSDGQKRLDALRENVKRTESAIKQIEAFGTTSPTVTEKHYAKWIPGGGDLYVQPPQLEAGDVPADLLTRLPQSPQSPHSGDPYALPESLKSLDLH